MRLFDFLDRLRVITGLQNRRFLRCKGVVLSLLESLEGIPRASPVKLGELLRLLSAPFLGLRTPVNGIIFGSEDLDKLIKLTTLCLHTRKELCNDIV